MKSLGRYEIVREIGRGNMGTVYLATDGAAGRQVALKVAHERASHEHERIALYRGLFFNEMRAASMLRHPYIVEVYESGVEDGERYYIAMEYVGGGETLERYCRPSNLAPLEMVVEVIFKCAEALDYAHGKGVIHRDVKPSNILMDRNGEIKLSDFSVALVIHPEVADTQVMETVGSPLYMSPEQIREESVTNRSDLFALGVVAYELLTGVHPFAASSIAALTHRILNEEPEPIDRHRPQLPAALVRIVKRAMAKGPGDRYASALELAADLSALFGALAPPLEGLATEGRVDVLRRLAFFAEFPDAEIWELLRWAEWAEFPDAARIIVEGEVDDAFYIIVSGAVRVVKGGQQVAVLAAGDCFGEIGYLSQRSRSASVISSGPVSTLKLNAQGIARASVRCQAQFQRVLIRTLIERLVQTTHCLVM